MPPQRSGTHQLKTGPLGRSRGLWGQQEQRLHRAQPVSTSSLMSWELPGSPLSSCISFSLPPPFASVVMTRAVYLVHTYLVVLHGRLQFVECNPLVALSMWAALRIKLAASHILGRRYTTEKFSAPHLKSQSRVCGVPTPSFKHSSLSNCGWPAAPQMSRIHLFDDIH